MTRDSPTKIASKSLNNEQRNACMNVEGNKRTRQLREKRSREQEGPEDNHSKNLRDERGKINTKRNHETHAT